MDEKVIIICNGMLEKWQLVNATFCLGWAISNKTEHDGSLNLPDMPIVVTTLNDTDTMKDVLHKAQEESLSVKWFPMKAFDLYNSDLEHIKIDELMNDIALIAVRGNKRKIDNMFKKYKLLK